MNDTTKVIPHPLTLISDMESELLSVLPTGLAVYMSSDPGIGKTHVVRAVARKLHAVVITLVASLLERFDLSGLPYTDTKGAVSVTTPGGLTE
jgi:MoxR-like ATPase